MELQENLYQAPALTSIGDFSEVTLGRLNWGFDAVWWCAYLGCWD